MTTTTNITTFDDLPSEIVLCIFDFLSPDDRYRTFFDCNSRLRSLVKRWTQYSRKGLYADVLRFSTLHSWYKHLEFENGGTLFFIHPQRGQQMRCGFDPCVTDAKGLHWHFIYGHNFESIPDERVRRVVVQHPFRLNPFFYHDESKHDEDSTVIKSLRPRSFYGGHIIVPRYHLELKTWLENNYPEYVKRIFKKNGSNKRFSYYDQALVSIFDGEWLKAKSAIREAADRVWNDLRDLEDVNPLVT